MAKKVTSFEENVKIVEETVNKVPQLNKDAIPAGVIENIPPEAFDKISASLSEALGGDGFRKYIDEFIGTFKTIAINVEMNTAGISALSKNIKYFKTQLDRMEKVIKVQNEILKIYKDKLGE